MALKIKGIGLTDVGRVRSINQDSFLADDKTHLYIVADGMGGHVGGEIASRMCAEQISAYLQTNKSVFAQVEGSVQLARIGTIMAQAINHSSTKIYEKALEDPTLKGMGTTATAIKIEQDRGFIAHVGDSRIYLLRQGLIYTLSNDHSLVSEQVRAGLLTKEEAELHHLKNVITRSVGYQEEEDVDTFSIVLEKGDLFLLCSDGLHGKVSDQEIAQLCSDLRLDAAPKLIALANERGGDDNITVVIVTAS